MKFINWFRKWRFFQFERPDDRRFFWEWCLLAFATVGIVGLCVAFSWLTPIGNIVFDGVQRVREQEPNKQIIIVSVDDRSLAELGGWPLSRGLYAEFLKNLADSGNLPKAIGLDILMIDPTLADPELAVQMARHNTILPAELRYSEQEKRLVVRPPPYILTKSASTLAHINVAFDEDGLIRGSNLVESGVPHFSLALSGLKTPAENGRGNYTRFSLIRPEIGFPTISLSDALQKNYPLSIFKDAYVVFGSTAPSLGDHYPSIYAGRQMAGTPGVVFHASLLNDILQNSLITVVGPQLSFLIYVLCLLIILFGILVLAPSAEITLTLTVLAATLFSSVALLLKFDVWFDPTPLIFAVFIAKPIWAWRRMKMIILFMRERAQDINSLEVAPAKVMRGQFLVQDAVLQYSNILDRAISIAKNRLENFEKIIHDLPEAMFILSEDKQLLLANQKFQSLFLKAEFNQKLSIDTLLGYLGYSLRQVEELLTLPVGKKYLNIRSADGSYREYMPHRVQLQLDEGSSLSLVMFVEVTALLQFQIQRDRTLQLLSHDMRTPVASILTLCRKALSYDSIPEDAIQPIRQVTSHSRRLLSMMDDFILSIRADEMEYTQATVLFETLLDQAIFEVKDLAEDRRIKIRVDEICTGVFVQVQSRLMERVLINLLVNALRYGQPDSEIVIRISEGKSTEQSPVLKCEFINVVAPTSTASGIEVENKGFGLGLNFVDQVIARHNGVITRHLPNQAGDTAIVTIEIPFSPAESLALN